MGVLGREGRDGCVGVLGGILHEDWIIVPL